MADEARTNGLKTESEKELQEILNEVKGHLLTISGAARAIARDIDRLLVLQQAAKT